MKVRDLMTTDVKSCTPDTNLATAAALMQKADCGVLPVVADTLLGVITDRDICLAASKKETSVLRTKVSDVISGEVYTCTTDDKVKDALKIMREKKVRRLPVVNEEGELKGILSLNDILIHTHQAKGKKGRKPGYKDVARTFEVVCAPLAKTATASA